jgi:hypothetical protein
MSAVMQKIRLSSLISRHSSLFRRPTFSPQPMDAEYEEYTEKRGQSITFFSVHLRIPCIPCIPRPHPAGPRSIYSVYFLNQKFSGSCLVLMNVNTLTNYNWLKSALCADGQILRVDIRPFDRNATLHIFQVGAGARIR